MLETLSPWLFSLICGLFMHPTIHPPNTVSDIKAADTTVKRLMSRSWRRLDKEFFFFKIIIIIPALENIRSHFHFGHNVQQNEIKQFSVNGMSGSLMA